MKIIFCLPGASYSGRFLGGGMGGIGWGATKGRGADGINGTGGGGAGYGSTWSGNGGHGIVIVRYTL